jgi:hypothetical protein
MMSIVYVFWMYVVLFGVIGAMRGWAKELLVAFSVILALALNHVLRKYIPINVANYPFQNVISRPTDPVLLQSVNQMMLYMPPQLLGEPGIYFAIILAFVFVIVVYI